MFYIDATQEWEGLPEYSSSQKMHAEIRNVDRHENPWFSELICNGLSGSMTIYIYIYIPGIYIMAVLAHVLNPH